MVSGCLCPFSRDPGHAANVSPTRDGKYLHPGGRHGLHAMGRAASFDLQQVASSCRSPRALLSRIHQPPWGGLSILNTAFLPPLAGRCDPGGAEWGVMAHHHGATAEERNQPRQQICASQTASWSTRNWVQTCLPRRTCVPSPATAHSDGKRTLPFACRLACSAARRPASRNGTIFFSLEVCSHFCLPHQQSGLKPFTTRRQHSAPSSLSESLLSPISDFYSPVVLLLLLLCMH